MSTELLTRAKEKLHRNELLFKDPTPGNHFYEHFEFLDKPSAHHDKIDKYDPTENAGHKTKGRRLPPITEHIVPFVGEREVKFVGPCAEKALAALKSWNEAFGPKSPEDWQHMTGSHRKLCSCIPQLTIEPVDGVPTLKLWKDTWNDYILALYQMGVGLSGLPL